MPVGSVVSVVAVAPASIVPMMPVPVAPMRALVMLVVLAVLLLAPGLRAAQAQTAEDCITRASFAEDLATRRDKGETQDAAGGALAQAVTRNLEANERVKQAQRALVADTARFVWSVPQLKPLDVAIVQRMLCAEPRATPARAATLAAAAEACVRDNPAQTTAQRTQCIWVKGGAAAGK